MTFDQIDAITMVAVRLDALGAIASSLSDGAHNKGDRSIECACYGIEYMADQLAIELRAIADGTS